ncbi:uncharacterized protein LOC127361738 isoform X4 [Dicentrarchus labrax]|uniref:uncharacterized protein LOC127361738 isoform X4 n=1 Tax=Dicentrarchus labrax TaxID=13489 RepID=UPI0021F54F50|nr:uncharacterized protein LOC127361738 isoform X4 [Dicentrarchus labrax]
MAQFIHLSLLLATIQLPLGFSATQIWLREGITFKFTGGGKVKSCSKSVLGDTVIDNTPGKSSNLLNDKTLTINKPKLNCNFVCYGNKKEVPVLYLNVTRGCIRTFFYGVDFSKGKKTQIEGTTKAGCRRCCTEDENCKYFTSHTKKGKENDKGKCFLFSSSEELHLEIGKSNAVSGYPLRNCTETNGGDEGLTFYQEAKSWIDALEYCQDERENSSLVHITNQTVQNAVKSLLAHKNDSMKNGAWIGLERSIFGKAPPWMWTSGPQVQESCKQWSSNFPVDCLNNHCGKIIWVTINGSNELKWQDACCHEQLPFICQAMNERSGHDDDHCGDPLT